MDEQKQTYLARLAAMVETVTDAAEMLGVTRTRVQQLIDKGDLEAVKVGRGRGAQTWVSSLSLQELIDRRRAAALSLQEHIDRRRAAAAPRSLERAA